MKSVTPEESWVLSYYRSSELAGALFFGRLARRTTDPLLQVRLTRHFADEARHAWLWTETITALGEVPQQIDETYQSEYARELGLPSSMTEILLLTQCFETRIIEHYRMHLERGPGHPLISETLSTLLADEETHIDWISAHLELASKNEVSALRERIQEADRRVYERLQLSQAHVWSGLAWGQTR